LILSTAACNHSEKQTLKTMPKPNKTDERIPIYSDTVIYDSSSIRKENPDNICVVLDAWFERSV
jgi:hypothetical protein